MRISDWSSDVCSSDLVRGKSAERPVDPAVYLEDGDLQHNAEHHGGGDLRVLVRDLAARDGRLDAALQHGHRRLHLGRHTLELAVLHQQPEAEHIRVALEAAASTEELPVGKVWVTTCKSRLSPYPLKNNKRNTQQTNNT